MKPTKLMGHGNKASPVSVNPSVLDRVHSHQVSSKTLEMLFPAGCLLQSRITSCKQQSIICQISASALARYLLLIDAGSTGRLVMQSIASCVDLLADLHALVSPGGLAMFDVVFLCCLHMFLFSPICQSGS